MSAAPQQRKTPYILSSLLGSINSSAYNSGNPDKCDGLVFFSADKTTTEKHKGYHVLVKNAAVLNQDQIDRILQIINENREKPVTFERPRKTINEMRFIFDYFCH